MRAFNSLGIYAATALGASSMYNVAPILPVFKSYGPGVRYWRVGAGNGNGSIAKANRHTGHPHTHAREIARRLRQQGNLK